MAEIINCPHCNMEINLEMHLVRGFTGGVLCMYCLKDIHKVREKQVMQKDSE